MTSRAWRPVAAVVCTALGVAFLASSCAWFDPYGQKARARTLTPRAAEGAERALAARDQLRVRVYLDADYRTQNADPDARVRAFVGEANRALVSAMGLAFVVVDVVDWDRRGAVLDDALEALRAADPGTDVDLVLGMVSSLPVYTPSLHELGRATVLGRHAVLCGMNDPVERRAIEAQLARLSDDERQKLLRARRLHKEVAVLLHEWAHTVGGVHVDDPEDFAHATYNSDMVRFDARTVDLYGLGVRWNRATSDDERRALAAQLQEQLRRADMPFVAADRDRLLSALEPIAAASAASAAAPAAPDDAAPPAAAPPTIPRAPPPPEPRAPFSPAERDRYAQAVELWNADDVAAAAAALAPLLVAYPDDAAVQRLGCLSQQPTPAPAGPRLRPPSPCWRVSALLPDDTTGPLGLARQALAEGDRPAAGAALDDAFARARRQSPPSSRWLNLARLAQELQRISDEDAAASVEPADAAALTAWARAQRRRFGLTRGSVDAAAEDDVLAVFPVVYLALDAKDLRAAGAAIDEAVAQHGEVAGLLALHCDVSLRRGRMEEASRRCARALQLDDEATIVHTAAAQLALRRGQTNAALDHVRRARALDPEHRPTWAFLAALLAHAGQRQELQRVAADYERTFGEPLPR